MPKSVQPKAKGHLHDIWQAETRAEAEAAFDFFVETYGVKYDKAVAKLVKDRDVLLAFYDFRPSTGKHIRTSNPIESTFATVRHRTGKTRGCLSRKTGLAMAFRLMMSAQSKWRKLDGANRLPEIIQGIAFEDGIKQLPNRRLITPSPTFGHSSGEMDTQVKDDKDDGEDVARDLGQEIRKMAVGYARVSTKEQGARGTSLEPRETP